MGHARHPPRRLALLGVVLACGCASVPVPALAQGVFDAVGVRALGMAGAFTAVADDPSAVHWNPAGLASGDVAGLTFGWHDFQLGKRHAPADGLARLGRSSLVSMGTWPLGLSVGSLDVRVLDPDGVSGPRVRRLVAKHGAVTVLQSVVDGLVVGGTTRLTRASFVDVAPFGTSVSSVFEAVTQVSAPSRTLVDFDLGLMATLPRTRAGLTLRNLRSPSVGATPSTTRPFPRQARVGVSVVPADGVTLAMDLDLNTVDLLGDLRRMSALGAEIPLGSRLLVRSGVRWNLATSSGPAGTVGVSVRVRRGWWLDAHFAQSRTTEARQVSVGLRAAP